MKQTAPSHLARPAGFLTFLGTGIAACARPAEVEDSWAQSLAYAQSLQPLLEAADYERDPLWGDREDGLAFESYWEAVELLFPPGDEGAPDALKLTNLLYRGWDVRGEIVGLPGEQAQSGADAFMDLPRVQAALTALREGAHRGDARPPIEWSAPPWEAHSLFQLRALGFAATYHADTLAASGEDVAAAYLLLDVAQLGLDLLRTPLPTHSGTGMAQLNAAPLGPWNNSTVGKLGPGGRDVLLAGLGRVLEGLALSPLTAAGDFVLHMRQAEALGQIARRHLLSGDGQIVDKVIVIEGNELTEWLAERRAACELTLGGATRGGGVGDLAGPMKSLEDSLAMVRYRLTCLQLALQLDLDDRASRESQVGGLGIAATIGEGEITVGFEGAKGRKPGYLPVTIRRSISK